MNTHPRLQRERKTIYAMQKIFCRDMHRLPEGKLCAQCSELFDYAMLRLYRCPYQEAKPTCANCPIHCYKKEKREAVRQMMRHSGPKMIFRHPVMAVLHLLDGRKKAPKSVARRAERESAD